MINNRGYGSGMGQGNENNKVDTFISALVLKLLSHPTSFEL